MMAGHRTSLIAVAVAATTGMLLASIWKYRNCGGSGGTDSSIKREDDLARAKAKTNLQLGNTTVDVPASMEIPHHLQRELYKEQRRKAKIPLLALKSPMYDNIQMMDPHGQVLSTVSAKKARWYVGKKLANWTSTSSIQLLFEPKSRSGNSTYTSSIKRNACVACASDDHIMRHYIVPYAYRSLLPQQYKNHLSHDVVILCPKCHLYCGQAYQERMKELEDSLRTDPATGIVSTVDSQLYNVRSCALALLNWRVKLPQEKIESYEKLVRSHLSIIDHHALSNEQLQQAIDVEYRVANPNYIPGAELVAGSIVGDHKKIAEFVRDWRKFFLDTVQPRHLPTGWTMDAPVSSGEGG